MKFREYDQFVKAQVMEGFEKGFGFEDFKKGEEVWFFHPKTPASEPVLFKGKIVTLTKEKNAKGEDRIRKIEIEADELVAVRVISGHQQIKNHLFKKVVSEEQPVKEEVVPEIVVGDEIETMIVERAMSDKNPKVKELIAEGWYFKGKEWSGERNMYLATMERAVQS